MGDAFRLVTGMFLSHDPGMLLGHTVLRTFDSGRVAMSNAVSDSAREAAPSLAAESPRIDGALSSPVVQFDTSGVDVQQACGCNGAATAAGAKMRFVQGHQDRFLQARNKDTLAPSEHHSERSVDVRSDRDRKRGEAMMSFLKSLPSNFGRWRFLVMGLSILLISACSERRSSFLDPGGPIAAAQRAHLIEVVAWTMIAILPVFILVPMLLWRYRYKNRKARYTPNWEFSGWLDLVMWGVPFIIIAVLSTLLIRSTHALDPYKPIASEQPPLAVQVVGLDWKWLFVYPDLGIATVNELAIPTDTSVALDLTSDTVMQSFIVPALAGQIYVMAGMRTKLHVLADEPGTFEGENVQFTGVGFTDQKFETLAMSPEDFAAWSARVKKDGVVLDAATYGRLAAASTGRQAHETFGSAQMPDGVIYFGQVKPGLFDSIIHRYMQGTPVPTAEQPGATGYVPPTAPRGDSQ